MCFQHELAKRPGVGTKGRALDVRSNFFEIKMKNPNVMVTQYHIEIHHPSSSRKLDRDECRQIFWKVIADNKAIFPNRYALAFDGSHQLYSPARINFPGERSSVRLFSAALTASA